ncbi:MAG: response regulator [Lachnospiraceae bacterium]
MIEVMVAEDELPIQRNLCNLIERINPAFHVTHRVANGKEAIDVLECNTVQLIFLDINMPVMDGMEVMNYISQKQIQVITVILSGYEEFAYAQKAISFGVMEYLVKPVNKEHLTKLLLKIEKELDSREYDRQMELYENLLSNKALPMERAAVDDELFYIILIYSGSYQMTDEGYFVTVRQRGGIEFVEKLLEEKFPKGEYWVLNGRCQAELVIVAKESVCGVSCRLNQILCAAEESNQIPLTIIMQRNRITLSEIYVQYESMVKFARESMLLSKHMFYWMRSEEKAVNHVIQKNYGFLYKNIVEISKELDTILCGDQLKRAETTDQIKQFFRWICEKSDRKYHYSDIEEDVLHVIETNYEASIIKEKLQEIIMSYFQFNEEESSNKKITAWKIKTYIDENYAGQINSTQLSSIFGFVPLYIRKIFREYYNLTPNEYLQQVRLLKAKELLTILPELSLKQIAEEIGYRDSLYFSKSFKKQFNISPSEYRKRVSDFT